MQTHDIYDRTIVFIEERYACKDSIDDIQKCLPVVAIFYSIFFFLRAPSLITSSNISNQGFNFFGVISLIFF
jgi:hypothetical protein